jgi:hypothetical protein
VSYSCVQHLAPHPRSGSGPCIDCCPTCWRADLLCTLCCRSATALPSQHPPSRRQMHHTGCGDAYRMIRYACALEGCRGQRPCCGARCQGVGHRHRSFARLSGVEGGKPQVFSAPTMHGHGVSPAHLLCHRPCINCRHVARFTLQVALFLAAPLAPQYGLGLYIAMGDGSWAFRGYVASNHPSDVFPLQASMICWRKRCLGAI